MQNKYQPGAPTFKFHSVTKVEKCSVEKYLFSKKISSGKFEFKSLNFYGLGLGIGTKVRY